MARCNIGGEDAVTEANGERIVACVNACKGINPKAVPDLLAVVDALVKAGGIMEPSEWFSKAKTALAKAKGIQ